MKNLLILVLAGLCLGSAAQAQQLYRCGNEYRKEPCADGKGKVVKTEGNVSKAVQVPPSQPTNYTSRSVQRTKADCDKLRQTATQISPSSGQIWADTYAGLESCK